MGLKKVIGIIFILLVVVAGIIGYDAYSTVNTLSKTDPTSMVGTPTFTNKDNKVILVTVTVTLPTAGFIPKGAKITVILSVGGGDNITNSETVNFGESKDIAVSFTMDTIDSTKLSSGGSITVEAWATSVPVILGFPLDQAEQSFSFGTFTVDGV